MKESERTTEETTNPGGPGGDLLRSLLASTFCEEPDDSQVIHNSHVGGTTVTVTALDTVADTVAFRSEIIRRWNAFVPSSGGGDLLRVPVGADGDHWWEITAPDGHVVLIVEPLADSTDGPGAAPEKLLRDEIIRKLNAHPELVAERDAMRNAVRLLMVSVESGYDWSDETGENAYLDAARFALEEARSALSLTRGEGGEA